MWSAAVKTGLSTDLSRRAHLSVANDRLYMAYRTVRQDTRDGEVVWYQEDHVTWYEGSDEDWRKNLAVPTLLGLGQFALGVYKGRLHICGKGFQNTAFEMRVLADSKGLKWTRKRLGAVITRGRHGFADLDGRFCVAYVAARDNQLHYLATDSPYWNGIDDMTRHKPKPLHEESFADDSPAVAVYKGRVFVAYKEEGGSGIWVVAPDTGARAAVPDQQTSHSPALAVFDARLFMAYKDDRNARIWITSTGDGRRWRRAQEVAGHFTSGPPSLAVYREQLFLGYCGEHGHNIWITRAD